MKLPNFPFLYTLIFVFAQSLFFIPKTTAQTLKEGYIVHFEIEGLENVDVLYKSSPEFDAFTKEMYQALQENLKKQFQLAALKPEESTPTISGKVNRGSTIKKLKKNESTNQDYPFNFKIIVSVTDKGTLSTGKDEKNRFVFIRVGVFDQTGNSLYVSAKYDINYYATTSDNFDGRVYSPKRMDFNLLDFRELFNKELMELSFIDANDIYDY